MATEYTPKIGDWYSTASGDNFEIVAVDDDDETLEVQYFDGAVEELDMDTWYEMEIVPIEPPEDWSGSMDLQKEDYGVDLEQSREDAWNNPLDKLDSED